MYERLDDVRSKVQWADKRIQESKVAVGAFLRTNPYGLKIETDLEGGRPCVHIIKADPIPPEIRLLAGDVIQNLRSALDYLACALVKANGKDPNPKTMFPVLDGPITTARHEAYFYGKVMGMRQEAIQAIRDIRPYHGGDNKLWRLHRLNNIDKHNLLVAAWGSIGAVNGLPPVGDQWSGNRWLGAPGAPFPVKRGTKFVPEIPGVEVDKDTGFFLEIALNEPGVAEGYPLILALVQSFKRVRYVVGRLSTFLK